MPPHQASYMSTGMSNSEPHMGVTSIVLANLYPHSWLSSFLTRNVFSSLLLFRPYLIQVNLFLVMKKYFLPKFKDRVHINDLWDLLLLCRSDLCSLP